MQTDDLQNTKSAMLEDLPQPVRRMHVPGTKHIFYKIVTNTSAVSSTVRGWYHSALQAAWCVIHIMREESKEIQEGATAKTIPGMIFGGYRLRRAERWENVPRVSSEV